MRRALLTAGQVTVPSGPTTINLAVAASGDDGYESFGTLDTVNTIMVLGSDYGDSSARAFARFTGVTIPAGATITAATLTVARGYGEGALQVRVRANAADNPAAPTTAAALSGLALTTAQSAQWTSTAAAWNAGGTVAAPSITAVIQEVVSRAGWAAGNALLIVIANDGSTGSGYFEAGTVDGSTAPTLSITYTT